MPNVYFFLILIGFLSLWFLNFLFGRHYRLSEDGFYYKWFFGKEFFVPWDKIKSIKIKNDFGYWRILLEKKLSRNFFHLFGKSFFFRVNIPMSCEFKREVKRCIPNDLQPEFPKQSLSSLISEKITEKIWCFVNKFLKFKNKNDKKSGLSYYNQDFFYNFKFSLYVTSFVLGGIYIIFVWILIISALWLSFNYGFDNINYEIFYKIIHILIHAFIDNFMLIVSVFIPGVIIMAFLIGFAVLFFLPSNYTLTNDGFYYKHLLKKKKHFVSWKGVDFIRISYESGFLMVDIFSKENSFERKIFNFLVRKNIGEEPELELKKYIPSDIKLEYFTIPRFWYHWESFLRNLKVFAYYFFKKPKH